MVLFYIRIALGVAALVGATFLVDEIGDRREAKVRAEAAKEVAKANERAAAAEAYWSAKYVEDTAARADALQKVIEGARGVNGCGPAPGLVEKLNLINPRGKR